MVPSSVESVKQLRRWREHLDGLISGDSDAAVMPRDQLAIENTIAEAIAVLAGETAPQAGTSMPSRPILARDLRITTDLVLRALEANETGALDS